MDKVVYILLLLPVACYCNMPPFGYGSIIRDPCNQFTELDNIAQRSQYVFGEPALYDDHYLRGGWYAAPAGWSLLGRDPGSWKRCGTTNPIYRTGKNGQLSSMCVRGEYNACAQSFNISTRMCGTREIHELTTPLTSSGFCFRCTGRKLDILIITDVSRSMTQSTFENIKQFQRSLLASIDVGQSTNAVALMEFSKTTRVLIPLDKPSSRNKADIRAMINQQQYENGPSTELADALDIAATEVFTGQKGDRPDADNMVILFTDGWIYKSEEEDVAAAIGPLSAKAEVFVVANRGINSVISKIASKPKADHTFRLGNGGAVSTISGKIMPCRPPLKGLP